MGFLLFACVSGMVCYHFSAEDTLSEESCQQALSMKNHVSAIGLIFMMRLFTLYQRIGAVTQEVLFSLFDSPYWID